MPAGEPHGTDWDSDTHSGKTYCIGSRKSSKYVRVYEKGKQLGSKTSKWVRFEVELKAQNCEIPLDSLLTPAEYFVGAYPICQEFENIGEGSRLKAIDKSIQIVSEHIIEYMKRQAGRGVNLIRKLRPDLTGDQILSIIRNKLGLLPTKYNQVCGELNVPEFSMFELGDKIAGVDDIPF